MKKNPIRFFVLLCSIACAIWVFEACKKENNSNSSNSSTSTSTSANPSTPAPTIISFSPSYGVIGDTLTITGTDFSPNTSDNTVKMGGVSATVLTATTTQLTIIVPQGSATGSILVTVNGQTAGSAETFTLQGPIITNFQPSTSSIGDSVTISGINFSRDASIDIVTINGTPAIVVSASDTLLVAIVPPNATSGKISVSVMGQGISTATNLVIQ